MKNYFLKKPKLVDATTNNNYPFIIGKFYFINIQQCLYHGKLTRIYDDFIILSQAKSCQYALPYPDKMTATSNAIPFDGILILNKNLINHLQISNFNEKK